MKKSPVYVIAEAGVNHNGSVELAKQMVEVAAKAGADAVKFQTFRAENLVTADTPKAAYQKQNQPDGVGQWKMLKALELSARAHEDLLTHCQKCKIEFLSTPFDIESLKFLVRLGVRKIKIPSGEITNGPLLLAAARTKLPIILSTGMSALFEVRDALDVLLFGYLGDASTWPTRKKMRDIFRSRTGQGLLRKKVTLLQCTTEYPAPFREMNVRAMMTLHEQFGCKVGLSDHSAGITASICAVALGASVIEKHFTLDRSLPGPDHRASLEPRELRALVTAIRNAGVMLGDGRKRPSLSEKKNISVVRKTLVAARPIKKGEIFTVENMTAKRAGTKTSPLLCWELLGRKSKRDLKRDEVIIP